MCSVKSHLKGYFSILSVVFPLNFIFSVMISRRIIAGSNSRILSCCCLFILLLVKPTVPASGKIYRVTPYPDYIHMYFPFRTFQKSTSFKPSPFHLTTRSTCILLRVFMDSLHLVSGPALTSGPRTRSSSRSQCLRISPSWPRSSRAMARAGSCSPW